MDWRGIGEAMGGLIRIVRVLLGVLIGVIIGAFCFGVVAALVTGWAGLALGVVFGGIMGLTTGVICLGSD